MLLPTTAIMAICFLTETVSIWRVASSTANSSRSVLRAFSACERLTTRLMDCSEEAWEIKMILIKLRARQLKSLDAIPGTPIMPLPERFSNTTLLMELRPVTGCASPLHASCLAAIRVPGAEGSSEFLILMGIPAFIAGWTA